MKFENRHKSGKISASLFEFSGTRKRRKQTQNFAERSYKNCFKIV